MLIKLFNSEELPVFFETMQNNRQSHTRNKNSLTSLGFEEKTKNVTVRLDFDEPADNLVYSEINTDFLAERQKTILFDK